MFLQLFVGVLVGPCVVVIFVASLVGARFSLAISLAVIFVIQGMCPLEK